MKRWQVYKKGRYEVCPEEGRMWVDGIYILLETDSYQEATEKQRASKGKIRQNPALPKLSKNDLDMVMNHRGVGFL